MSSLIPYFAPAEWVYFTDEDIPYEVRTLEVWNPDDTSLFIKNINMITWKLKRNIP